MNEIFQTKGQKLKKNRDKWNVIFSNSGEQLKKKKDKTISVLKYKIQDVQTRIYLSKNLLKVIEERMVNIQERKRNEIKELVKRVRKKIIE